MAIAFKASIANPKISKRRVSAGDSKKLISALDRLKVWVTYAANPTATPKLDKAKNVESIIFKASPVATKPDWAEYSKTTAARKTEWDRMIAAADAYIDGHHADFQAQVKAFEKAVTAQTLTKSDFDKLWKTQQLDFKKAAEAYAKSKSNGSTMGVKLAEIPPDPVEVELKIKKPKPNDYAIGGNSIRAVYTALSRRAFWGRYRSNATSRSEFTFDGMLQKFTLTAAPTIQMPKWGYYSKATQAQKDMWDKMYKILKAHEDHHHEIFVTAANAFKKELEAGQFTRAAFNTRWSAVESEWQKLQDDYDSSSKHGVNEGVILDWSVDP